MLATGQQLDHPRPEAGIRQTGFVDLEQIDVLNGQACLSQ
jgi:hypothetical protein